MNSGRNTNPEGVYVGLDELVRLRPAARGFSFLPRQPITSILAGRHASRLRGRGLDFDEMRHYRPGDDIRSVDWKITARTKKPHVRVYREERDRPALFVVDQRASMFFGSRTRMKSVAAAQAAALGLWRVLDQGDRVGAVVFGDEQVVSIRPHRSGRRALRILETIVEMNRALDARSGGGTGSAGRLAEALRETLRLAAHDFLVVVVSDFAGARAECASLLKRLAWHNDVIAVAVSDPLERTLPSAGPLVFQAAEGDLEVDTSDDALRRRFTDAFDDIAAERERFLRRLAVPVIPVDTTGPVAPQVREAIGRASAARRRAR